MPFVHIVAKNGASPSVASVLNASGYQSIGLHAYHPTMYKRNIAYKNLGFEAFYGASDFVFQEKNGNSSYINDASSYRETLARLADSDQKMLISLVTMENHMPYDNTYDEHNFVSTTEIEGIDHHQLENYYESLHYSDQALGEFIVALDEFEEKTVVLFYGDHLSGVIHNFPEEALTDGLMHETPFFVYANFELEEEMRAKDLGVVSPNYLISVLFDTLNLQKAARYYLLDELRKSVPVLAHSFYYNREPEWVESLVEYELLNYDLLFGRRYWVGD
jgi:phosphoglycerol transferase MdoB-like AlkP superfamily enzyme